MDATRAPSRARTAAAGRLGPRSRGDEVGPPHLLDVGRRPDGRAARQVPALRLRRPGEPGQRPSDLLEGPRLAAPLLDLQGGRRDRGRGAPHVPQVRQPARGSSDPGPPVGGRGHRLAGAGAADRGGRRAGGQAPRPAPVPRLGALRRQRDGRGLDVGGVRARVLRQARQPDRHRRRQPARPARRDDARLGSRLVHAPGGGLWLPRDRDRRPRRRGDRRGLRGGARGRGATRR